MAENSEMMSNRADTLFLISKLVIDEMENDINAATYYKTEGYVESEDVAKRLVAEAGNEEGTGWPIPRGSKKSKRIYMKIKRADLVTQHHERKL